MNTTRGLSFRQSAAVQTIWRLLRAWVVFSVLCGSALAVEEPAAGNPQTETPLQRVLEALVKRLNPNRGELGMCAPPLPVKVEPIKIPEKPVLQRDFDEKHFAWCERVWIAPFKARLKGDPWDAAATVFVEESLRQWVRRSDRYLGGGVADEDRPTDLAEEGRRLVAQGCNDVLVLYLTGSMDYRANDNWRTASEYFEAALKKIEEDPKISRALAAFVATSYLRTKDRGGFGAVIEPVHNKAIAWLGEALTDGSYGKDDDAIFVHQQLAGSWSYYFDWKYDDLANVYTSPSLPLWARHTLAGAVEIKRAWEARGSGWAYTVTEEGWKGFREHLAKARSALVRGWQLRPDRPEAPTKMISVVMGGCESQEETERLWFDRAIAAQFDYLPAYRALEWAYRPRWGGSHALMLEFAKACLGTRRFDTAVPLEFFTTCNDIALELDDWRAFYKRKDVSTPLMELSRALLDEPTRQKEKTMRQSFLAVNAWLTGDYEQAESALRNVGEKLHSSASSKLRLYRSDEATMRAEVAIFNSAGAGDFKNGDRHYRIGALEAARSAYEAAAAKAGPAAQALLAARLAIVEFERLLATGDWVKVIPDAALAQWNVRAGNWSAAPDGTLVNKGADREGLILYRGRVGPRFEMRGEFEIDAAEGCCRNMGVAFGWRKELNEEWITCQVAQQGRGPITGQIRHRYKKPEGPKIKIDLKPRNTFLVRCKEGKITFELNDQAVFTEHQPDELTAGPDSGLIGFCSHKFCGNNTTRIRNIQIRRLAAADPTQ